MRTEGAVGDGGDAGLLPVDGIDGPLLDRRGQCAVAIVGGGLRELGERHDLRGAESG